MTSAPPREWRDALGQAAAMHQHADQVDGDRLIAEAWAHPHLCKLPPEEAAATWTAMQLQQDAAGADRLVADGTLQPWMIWREDYVREWRFLVHGECDFEGPEQEETFTAMWQEHCTRDAKTVAQSDFKDIFTAEQQEAYRRRRESGLWKPPAA